MKPEIALTDSERFPLLSDLSFLHEHAPAFNFKSGDRLQRHHLEKVLQYEQSIRFQKAFRKADAVPEWMNEFLSFCIETVPYYKGRGSKLEDQPTVRRLDVKAQPWMFVSSACALDDLLVYQTSGTTGPAMDVLFDPVSQACWLPQLQSVLDVYGISLDKDPKRVAIALVCAQTATLTYASLSTYLNGSGVLKINLNPSDWRHPSDCKAYLEKYDPEIITGDPFAFLSLLELDPGIHPKALVSSAMKLTDGLKARLESRFGCPALDIYSLTECRMIAFAAGGRHRAIRPDLHLEVFDKDTDVPLPYGERGELVVTGGNNPFLRLIRYRTGDHCSLAVEDGITYLEGLEARSPVVFYDDSGKMVNNIEVSRALSSFPLAGFTLRQHGDHSLSFKGWTNENLGHEVENILRALFGGGISLGVEMESAATVPSAKPVTYSSAFGLLGEEGR
jgi:phenylacetate-CoA ligase